MFYLALLASLIVIGQIIAISVQGEAVCLNEGCKVVEGLLTISPLLFNGLGLCYFQLVMWLSWWSKRRAGALPEMLRIALFSGMAVEGVLFSYQLVVVRTFCSYCLVILALVVLLNVMAGWRQLVTGAILFGAITGVFPLLSFDPVLALSIGKTSLDSGTYAVRNCLSPNKSLYLFFSADCPHCQKVIKTLEGCSGCEFHLNPVERIASLGLPDLDQTPSYNPAVNRLLLALMGIDAVPVLLSKEPDGLKIIRSEQNIITFLEQACLPRPPALPSGSFLSPDQGQSTVQDDEEGECGVPVDCK